MSVLNDSRLLISPVTTDCEASSLSDWGKAAAGSTSTDSVATTTTLCLLASARPASLSPSLSDCDASFSRSSTSTGVSPFCPGLLLPALGLSFLGLQGLLAVLTMLAVLGMSAVGIGRPRNVW